MFSNQQADRKEPFSRSGVKPESDHPVADLDLARMAATGDRAAFEVLYRRHLNRVYGLCLRLTADKAEAEILTQDTFVKAWSALPKYSGKGELAAWLGRIAVNLRRDHFRRLNRRERLLREAAAEAPRATASSSGIVPLLTAMDLERGIAQLPERARTVFVLHEIEGFAHREIGVFMDVATGTVKAQLHRARKMLRQILSEKKENHEG